MTACSPSYVQPATRPSCYPQAPFVVHVWWMYRSARWKPFGRGWNGGDELARSRQASEFGRADMMRACLLPLHHFRAILPFAPLQHHVFSVFFRGSAAAASRSIPLSFPLRQLWVTRYFSAAPLSSLKIVNLRLSIICVARVTTWYDCIVNQRL